MPELIACGTADSFFSSFLYSLVLMGKYELVTEYVLFFYSSRFWYFEYWFSRDLSLSLYFSYFKALTLIKTCYCALCL